MMGMHGEAWVNQAIQESDLLIACGMRFDDRVTGVLATYAPNAKKIHIEIDPAEINKNVKVDVALIGDLREILEHSAAHCAATAPPGSRRSRPARATPRCATSRTCPTPATLYAAHVMHDLWRATDGNAIVVTDVGQHQMWEAQYYKHERRAP